MSDIYNGSTRKIVFAFDVGTTQTGISYCILDPGEPPLKRSMHKFPGHEYTLGSHKIPSVMYYNKEGKMEVAGAETLADEIVEKAEEEEWIKVEWFKLRLRPKHLAFDFNNTEFGPLPPGKNIDEIYTDFYAYLMKCCESFIKEVHPTYAPSWDDLSKSAEFILCHPKGWGGAQQDRMRRAAIKAGLVPDTEDGRGRIQFVTEGEASLHYCIEEKHLDLGDEGFIVADLGGGTLDFSAYRVESRDPVKFHESAPARCALEGSEIITKRAKTFLTDKLRGSRYGTEDDINEMVKVFDSRNKRTFRSVTETIHIPFGRVSYKDPIFGISGGKVKLSGLEVAKLFEPSITAVEKHITKCILSSPVKISAVYLVGGLSGSNYVKSELVSRFQDASLEVRSPSDSTVKAAAAGALGFYLDHYVKARVARVSYGLHVNTHYVATNPEHVRRKDCGKIDPLTGYLMIPDKFDTILQKGTTVEELTKFERPYSRKITRDGPERTGLRLAEELRAYLGPERTIEWIDEVRNSSELKVMCIVKGDLSALHQLAPVSVGMNGVSYQYISFSVVLWFGGPELKAQLCWKEDGEEKMGPATIIYEDDCVSEQEQKLNRDLAHLQL